ncbi:hypothetical protein NC652_004432 [Populus alba x Populus x berolinensis]|nr:hypothetical protein NC652_004432 [Populus alba x Populus x berolinensis]
MQVGCLITNRRGGHELSIVSLETLHLNLLPDLRCIWKGLLPSNLNSLEVNECKRLTHVFTDSMIANLVQLKVLKILACEELEQIVAKDNDDEKDKIFSGSDLQSACFPNLWRLEIRGCNKLKSLFPIAMASGLKKLKELKVRESSQLLGVFGQDDHASPANIEKEMVLRDLQELLLVQLPSISSFSLGCSNFLFPHLKKLEVDGCPKLTIIFGTTSNGSMSAQSEGFMNLKEISIENLEGVQDLMQVGCLITNRRGGHELSIVSLETLHLNLLPDLRCIWKGLLPSNLTSLEVNKCKRLTHVFTDSMIANLVQLKVLKISACEELEQIVAKDNDDEKDKIFSGSDLQSACFPNLWRLEIRGCNKLKSLFLIAMASSLKKLKELEVSESSQLLGVFGQDDHASPANIEKEMVLPDLQELLLVEFASISSFSLGCSKFLFPQLKKLEVDGCPKLTIIFGTTSNGSMSAQSEGFMNLKEISIENLEGVQDLMQVGCLITNRRGGHELSIVSLETLHLNLLPDLRCIWKGLLPSNLNSLEVNECKRLTHVFTDSMIANLVQLKVLKISACEELEQIVAKDNDDERDKIFSGSDLQSACFPNLWRLEIRGCNKLKSLFPIAMASGLKKLKELKVRESSQLLGVFGQDDHASPANIEKEMVLPDLQELLLVQLPSISSFSLGCSNFLFPYLKKLEVDGCPKLTIIFGTTSNGSMSAQSEGFMNLKEISIENLEGVQDLMQVGCLITNRRGGHELSIVSLETLHLNLLPDLRCIWKGLLPSNLNSLEVNECKRLTHVFTDSMIANLVQLKVLKISACEELEQIVAKDNDDEKDKIFSGSDLQSACFPNLWRLEIRGCNKLKSLFLIAMASSLKKLKELEVSESSQLLGVFGQDDHASPANIEKEMVLPDLQELLLVEFASISSFSLGCSKFLFPQLKKLEVDGCPKLTIIFGTTSNGSMSAQSEGFMNLKEISIENLEGVQDLMQVGCLITNRRGGHELSIVSLETLHLNLLPDLRCIWKGLLPSNLNSLEVNECKRLTHVFTDSMIANLVQLKVLKISACEELEQIVAKDNDDEKDKIFSGSDLQSACFPNLWRLEIRGCNKLKSLFPIAMASSLKKLKELEVSESSQLLGVFGQDDHASPANLEKEMVLPDLLWLTLYKLPSIVCFSHGCYDFIFPHLLVLEVRQCPKLTTKFATTSNGSMSAQSEVSQVAEGSNTGCSVPTSTDIRLMRKYGWKDSDDLFGIGI